MGQKLSLLNKNENYRNNQIHPDEMQILATQEELIREITEISINLAENYNKEFLRPDFCNRVALVATEKLGNFSKSQLDDVVYTLGVVAEDPMLKENLCQAIIDHYMKRIQLISTIINSLEPCSKMVKAVNTGPICVGNPDIFDKQECNDNGNNWQNFNFMTYNIDKNAEQNKAFLNSLNNLNIEFTRDLEAIKKILEDVMNINYNIADEQLDNLQIETQQLITTMEYKCKLYYYEVLLNPPMTWNEIQNDEERANLRQQLNEQLIQNRAEINKKHLEIKNSLNDISIPEAGSSP